MASIYRSRLGAFVARFFAGCFIVLLALYLYVLAVNSRDRPPTAVATQMRALIEQRPQVPAEDNAYLFVLGVRAPDDIDPREAGKSRLAWIESRGYAEGASTPDPLPTNHLRQDRPKHIQQLIDTCRPMAAACVAEVEATLPAIAEWLSPDELTLVRYQQLLEHPAWLESIAPDYDAPLPNYEDILDGQRLYFVALRELSLRGQTDAVRERLEKDIRFWRMVLRSADTILVKAIAATALHAHFASSMFAFKALPVNERERAIPASWSEEISVEERSIRRALAGELMLIDRTYLATEEGDLLEKRSSEKGIIWRAVYNAFMYFYQHQDAHNRIASDLDALARAFEGPLSEYAEQRSRFAQEPTQRVLDWLYNPIGDYLFQTAASVFREYTVRFGDIEGVRRAALLTARLRASGVTAENIEERLRESSLRNPYTNEPFAWNAADGTVEFVGLGNGKAGRQGFVL